MQISNIEKVVSYYSSICEALPIGGHGIKVLHDALLEIAVLKAGGVAALQPTNSSSPKLPCPHLDNVGGCIKTVGHKKCTCEYVNRQLRAS